MGDSVSSTPEEGQRMKRKRIEEVLKEKTDEWMSIAGVQGMGVGMFEGGPCIKIFTSSKPSTVQAKIPSTVGDYRVIIEQTGAFGALDQR